MLLNLIGTLLNTFTIGKGTNKVGIRSNSGVLQGQDNGGSWTNILGQTGSSGFTFVAVNSTNYSMANNESFATVTTGSSDRTITLPPAANVTGKEIVIKKVDSGTGGIIIEGDLTDTLDGSLNKTIGGQYSYMRVVSDGDNWHIVSNAMWG